MALRALMKRKELDRLNAELETLRNTAAGFEAREADIATMIEEAETDEERSASTRWKMSRSRNHRRQRMIRILFRKRMRGASLS